MFDKSSHKSQAIISQSYHIYSKWMEIYMYLHRYIYWIQKNIYKKWEGEQRLNFFHFIVTKGNILSIKLDFMLQYESIQCPFVLLSISVEYLVEQFPYHLDIEFFQLTSARISWG